MTVRQEVVAAAGRVHDPDTCEQQRQLEVSIAYSIALMDYWLSSASASRATDDATGS